MTFSKEWKRILRDELPFYMDAYSRDEAFPLVVNPSLFRELSYLSGKNTFTHQVAIDGNTYYFKTSRTAGWDLWKVVPNPNHGKPLPYEPHANSFNVAGWTNIHIAVVSCEPD